MIRRLMFLGFATYGRAPKRSQPRSFQTCHGALHACTQRSGAVEKEIPFIYEQFLHVKTLTSKRSSNLTPRAWHVPYTSFRGRSLTLPPCAYLNQKSKLNLFLIIPPIKDSWLVMDQLVVLHISYF